jgi:choline dehydrogenase-like flavoprotein
MNRILIVGSGASGVHFALSVLKKGYFVTMLDVGWEKPGPINPNDNFNGLKEKLNDPVRYFLGDQFQAVVYPGSEEDFYTKYYGFPPSKKHVFSHPNEFGYEATGFEPLISFAAGGLAEAWTGGAYPLNDFELRDFPFQYRDIEPHYSEVAARIGLNGSNDDLARFFPLHDNLMEPLNLDQHSNILMQVYEKQRTNINERFDAYMGRSRVTTHSQDQSERNGCTYCARCLWGCPSEALYTPSITLRECLRYPNFQHLTKSYVSHFKYNSEGKITSIVAQSLEDQQTQEFTADVYVLAAGALSSSKIFIESLFRATGEMIRLPGLMDNRQILIPFINLRMLGKAYDPESYQYHQIALGLECEKPEEYIHGQITTLKSALAHPIIQNLPFDLNTSAFVFRNLRSCLGVVNLNLHDRRRNTNYLTLKIDPRTEWSKLVIEYTPAEYEAISLPQAIKKVSAIMRRLGCFVPPWMVHIRPMGASVHYSGTIPMSDEKKPFTTSKYYQSHDFSNLYIVNGTTMPFLPAKNITFTLMANAVRVAENAF